MRGSAAVLNSHFASCDVAVDVRVTFGAKTAATKAEPDSNTMSKRHNEISRNGSYCVNYTGRLVFFFYFNRAGLVAAQMCSEHL